MKLKLTTLILIFLVLLGPFVANLPFFKFDVNAYAADLQSEEVIINHYNTGILLLDRQGRSFYRFYQGRRLETTPLEDIPQTLKEAVVAAEDKHFYEHHGFSWESSLAALVANIRRKEIVYGGSTITQQLVKNSLLTPDRSMQRKYQEVLLAREVERRYSKKQILEMYLSSTYFGEGAFGAKEAARIYFNKPLDQLDVAEAAMLAGILVAPSKLSPISGDKTKAQTRQWEVLDDMYRLGYISAAQMGEAQKEELAYNPNPNDGITYQAPHFALMVRDELNKRYGEDTVAHSGFVVQTSIDLDWQKEAEKAVQDQVAKLARNRVSNGAAVVMDPKTGEVLALVGSKNWFTDTYGQVNIATSLRQPGSSFKPVVYIAALEKKAITPASILDDTPTTFGKNYKPQDYDRKYRGRVTVRRALSNSLNIPAVQLQQRIGVSTTLNMAKRLGLSTLDNFSNNDLSISLGAGEVRLLEMTGAYATLANQGQYNPATLIKEIKDRDGTVIYNYKATPKPVVDSGESFLITSILSDKQARKEIFGNTLDISRPAAVKTGTSQNYKDSWTLGYTPSLSIGVWVGNNDGTPMDQVAGSLGAAPIWRNLMEKFSSGTPVEEFSKPADVVQVAICKGQEMLAPIDDKALASNRSSSYVKEYFTNGTQPTRKCSLPTPTPSPSPTPSGQPDSPPADQNPDRPNTPPPNQEPIPQPTPPNPQPIIIQVPPSIIPEPIQSRPDRQGRFSPTD